MNILMIDDHRLFAEGVKLVLSKLDSNIQITTSNSCAHAFDIINQGAIFDLVTLELTLSGMDGFHALRHVVEKIAFCPVVVVSRLQNILDVRKAISLGAKGYIPKTSTASGMLSALQLILSGGVYIPPETLSSNSDKYDQVNFCEYNQYEYNQREVTAKYSPYINLTPRQTQVLKLLVRGKVNKEIASILNCAEATVKAHVTVVLKTLGVRNRTQATWRVEEMGLSL